MQIHIYYTSLGIVSQTLLMISLLVVSNEKSNHCRTAGTNKQRKSQTVHIASGFQNIRNQQTQKKFQTIRIGSGFQNSRTQQTQKKSQTIRIASGIIIQLLFQSPTTISKFSQTSRLIPWYL